MSEAITISTLIVASLALGLAVVLWFKVTKRGHVKGDSVFNEKGVEIYNRLKR